MNDERKIRMDTIADIVPGLRQYRTSAILDEAPSGPREPAADEQLRRLSGAGAVQWTGKKLAPMTPIAHLRGNKSLADLIVEDRR